METLIFLPERERERDRVSTYAAPTIRVNYALDDARELWLH